MNCGGAAVLPSTSVVTEKSVVESSGMTYDDERLSARWKERRARFLGCIENTKLIAERTKQRQEYARKERLKKERAEMEKYRRRYLEAAMKQHMEQQAKSREMPSSSMIHSGLHHPQFPSAAQAYSGCIQQVHGCPTPFPTTYPSVSTCKPNVNFRLTMRKRPHDSNSEWTQYASMSVVNDPHCVYPGKGSQVFQNGINSIQMANPPHYFNMVPKQIPYAETSYNEARDVKKMISVTVLVLQSDKTIDQSISQHMCNVPEHNEAEQYDQTTFGDLMSPATSQAEQSFVSTITEEMNSLSAIPEVAESHVKDLMDEIKPGNSLDDLGGNCLDGVLTSHCDEEDLVTEKNIGSQVQSLSAATISPMSVSGHTPINAVSPPTHLSASTRCSANTFYESHSTAVTPQQNAITSPADQSHLIQMGSPLAAAVTPLQMMRPENSSMCTSSAGDNQGVAPNASISCVPLASPQPNCISNYSANMNGNLMYSNQAVAAVQPVVSIPPSVQSHQHEHIQHHSFSHFQSYQSNSCHQQQQQQLLHLFNNGYHMSTRNVPLPQLNNTRTYNGIDYSRFGQYYNQHNHHTEKQPIIFPRLPSQSVLNYSTEQYDAYSMKYPNVGMSCHMHMNQTNMDAHHTYQCKFHKVQGPSPYQIPCQRHPYYGSDMLPAAQNASYPMNQF
ncbi:unnamed protein product [Thelazia callipaeda]|uniref:MamL-1 domain-containing protein n=1 Tax=Thelazia callipaeda TaxID=103827 RepID=A0A0N5D8S6_THECL|nr:unnamed protein product [Thelazia callipaeda]